MDLISRQAALDALIALTVYSNKRDLVKEADNHPNTWIEGVAECIDEIEDLPSAQPEIIECENCKHRGEKPVADGRYWCNIHGAYMYYCSDAERRIDE